MRLLIAILSLVLCLSEESAAQALGGTDPLLEEVSRRNIPTIDFFLERLNSAVGAKDQTKAQKDIISLFFPKKIDDEKAQKAFLDSIVVFADSVIAGKGRRYELESDKAFCEVECQFVYAKKNVPIKLFFQKKEKASDEYCWKLAGVSGLKRLRLYSDKSFSLGPVDNEVNFIILEDIFSVRKNTDRIADMRAETRQVDEMWMFFGLVHSGALKFAGVKEVRYHLFGVAGHYLVVSEIKKFDIHSGWLITSLLPYKKDMKKEELKYLTEK